MMVRSVFASLGLAAASLTGLFFFADVAAAQSREGRQEGRQEGRADRQEGRVERQEGRVERQEGRADRQEGRAESREGRAESRYDGGYFGDRGSWGYNRGYVGGYYGPYSGWGYGRGFYGPSRGYWGRGDGFYGSDGYYSYSDDGYYYDGGRRRGFFGGGRWRRGGDYGSYGYGGCYGSSCTGGYYGAGCTGGYYGAGCTGRSYGQAESAVASEAMNGSSDKALIKVKVAPDAEISFNDFKTTQTGADRQFITPALEPNRNFTYELHVRANGAEQTRKITVHAGQQLMLDLTQPAEASQRAEGQGENIKAPRKGQQYGAEGRTEDKGGAKTGAEARTDDKGGNKTGAEARTDDKRSAQTKTHEGQVVRVSNNELVMKDASGKEHKHTLAKDAKITIDGKAAKAEDLKPDMKIEVTTSEADMKTALQVDAKSSK